MPSYGQIFSQEELDSLTAFILTEIEGKTKEMLLSDNPDFSGLVESNELNFRLETLTDQIDGIP
ncbi:MAG: hypothetical protein ACI9GZ_000558 [Bacteroidia bacterium]|jgi:hypothetical protein